MSGEPPSVALSDPIPLIFISGALFMAPFEKVTVSPGTTPCNPFAGSVNGFPSIVRATFTVDTAPVRFSFLCEPKPTTTSSSSTTFSSRSTTSTTALPFTGTLVFSIPTRENSSTASSCTIISYKPSMSVMAIFAGSPTATTVTPAKGSPATSVTLPLTVISSRQIPAGYPANGILRSSSTITAPLLNMLDLNPIIRSIF